MTTINLLPWRDTLRKERQQKFFTVLGISVGVMLAVIGAVHLEAAKRLDHQNMRNTFLEEQIVRVDLLIKEINTLEKKKQNLLDRMEVIQQLQQGRPQIVHIFDALVKTLPDGVYLTSLKQSNGVFSIQGYAQSNARVSAFMRNLDGSEWFSEPKLSVIESSKKKSGRRNSKFTLNVSLTNKLKEEENS
ncbi:MAG: PilN domain-containing protein [Gammaproteobacteria bacterium]|nr:PilN domain-containing protein [Gammaproteobacteria bacterium]